jgi:hypothetical protein
VTRLLIEKYGIPAGHIGAVGYGDTHPIAPNDTPEDRAKNRRVVFFIKSSSIPKPPAGKAAAGKAVAAPAAAPAPAPTAPPPAEPVPAPGPVGETVPPQPPSGGP